MTTWECGDGTRAKMGYGGMCNQDGSPVYVRGMGLVAADVMILMVTYRGGNLGERRGRGTRE